MSGERKAVLLGAYALQHPAYGELQALAQAIAQATGARLGCLVEAADSVGAGLVGCQPGPGGLDAAAQFAQPRKAYLLLGAEPELEAADAAQARQALESAELVVVLSAFKGSAPDYAHVLLPVAAFAETAGSYVNMEGRLQAFRAAVTPPDEARPAWKVLRVLGNQFDLPGFDYNSAEAVRAAALPDGEAGIPARLSNALAGLPASRNVTGDGLERLAETPIYQADALVRRAPALQATADGAIPCAGVNGADILRLGLVEGKPVKVIQGDAETILKLRRDDTLPAGVVRVAGGHAVTARLGPRFGNVRLEKM
jgi:NADH-quinone oxidoreductase subunit G